MLYVISVFERYGILDSKKAETHMYITSDNVFDKKCNPNIP
jgi:hypothetical protein